MLPRTTAEAAGAAVLRLAAPAAEAFTYSRDLAWLGTPVTSSRTPRYFLPMDGKSYSPESASLTKTLVSAGGR
jgi:hypothetical protein